jgi:hypothetical protein
MSLQWSFRCYVSSDGTDVIRSWYDAQRKKVRAKFLSRLKTLAGLPPDEWHETLFKNLHGECKGISEIRFKADGVQHRPLGYRSGKLEFTLLFCAIEKGGKFVPLSACEIAQRRKNKSKKDRSATNALWLALE